MSASDRLEGNHRVTSDSYAAAGVDTAAGDLAVELMKAAVGATHGPQVLGGVGGFAGLFDVSALKAYAHPLLATSTDGVGTKIAIAQALDKHDTIGQDLVGMVVDDIVVVRAKPLFMTDYIACGKVVPVPHRGHRRRHRARLLRHRHRPGRRRDRRAPRPARPGRLRRRGRGRRRRRGGCAARRRPRPRRRRRHRDRLLRAAQQRLLARAPHPRAARASATAISPTSSAGWWARCCSSRPGSTRRRSWRCSPSIRAPSTRSATSRAAASPRTSHACSRRTPGSRSTASPGRRASVFRVLSHLAGTSLESAEGTWNLGIGMIAVVAADAAADVIARLAADGIRAWLAGVVSTAPATSPVSSRAPRVSPGARCA